MRCVVFGAVDALEKTATTINGWLQLIVADRLLFSIFYNDEVIPHVRVPRIYACMLMKYMELVTQCVKGKIASGELEKVAVMFDGWHNAGTHYGTIFFTHPT